MLVPWQIVMTFYSGLKPAWCSVRDGSQIRIRSILLVARAFSRRMLFRLLVVPQIVVFDARLALVITLDSISESLLTFLYDMKVVIEGVLSRIGHLCLNLGFHMLSFIPTDS